MNIAWTSFLRFCRLVIFFYRLASAFLIYGNGHPFGGTCICGTIIFSEISGLIFGVVWIKYGRTLIFQVLKYLGNWSRRLQSKFSKGFTWNNSKPNFWRKYKQRNVIRINTAVLGNNLKRKAKFAKVISQILQVLVLVNIHCAFLLLEKTQ